MQKIYITPLIVMPPSVLAALLTCAEGCNPTEHVRTERESIHVRYLPAGTAAIVK